jgi:hypothetical protein
LLKAQAEIEQSQQARANTLTTWEAQLHEKSMNLIGLERTMQQAKNDLDAAKLVLDADTTLLQQQYNAAKAEFEEKEQELIRNKAQGVHINLKTDDKFKFILKNHHSASNKSDST